METNKPKSWAVLNDGSERFKDTVIKYLNENKKTLFNGCNLNSYYGIDINGEAWDSSIENLFSTVLTIDEFCQIFLEDKVEEVKTYTEEDLKRAFYNGFDIGANMPVYSIPLKTGYFEEWFEQFKKQAK